MDITNFFLELGKYLLEDWASDKWREHERKREEEKRKQEAGK